MLSVDFDEFFFNFQVFEQSKVSSDFYRLCLHQNFPHFLTNVENARRAVEYLSDADCLSDRYEPTLICYSTLSNRIKYENITK